jgi:SAM-dependent methyltransferase
MVQSHRHASAASPWVARFAALVPPGEVLDLAAGGGRHARLFADRGHAVLAVDRDAAALLALEQAGSPLISTLQCDLEQAADGTPAANFCWPFAERRFAAIVVTNYLHRPLLSHLAGSLIPGGMLLYETFAIGNERFGKPSNPAFLLASGELLATVASSLPRLNVIAFEDGYIEQPAPAMVQRLCARRAAGAGAVSAGSADSAGSAGSAGSTDGFLARL